MAEYKGESLTKEEWEKQQQAAPVNAITGKPFGQASEEAVQSKAQEFRQDNPAVPSTTAPPDTRSGLEQGLDWLKTPAGTAAVGAAGLLAGYGIAGLKSRRLSQQRTPTRVEPTLADGGFPPPPPPPPPAAAPVDRNAQAAQRLAEFEALAAKLGGAPVPAPVSAPVPAPAAPAPQPATVLVANPNRTSPWDPAQIEVPNPAVAPATPAIAKEAPKTAVAIETQQPGSKVAEAVVLDELNTPAAAQPAGETAAEPSKTVAGRARRTKAQIDADLAAAFAAAPPGMRPAAPRKTNKLPGDVVGQGGWHFFAGQGGNPEDWLRLYGRNPQPYSRVVSDIKGGLLPIPPAPPGALGGDIPRAAYVPEFIRGRASPGSLTGLAAIAGALGLAGSEQGREAMGRAAAAIRDIGISPDIFAGKGEELGRLGQGYVTAGNPAYLRELSKQLETETDSGRRAVLMREFQKAGGSAGGRGIAPPMR